MKKKIVIATGGTGGHVYPAMATAEALIGSDEAEVLFIGAGLHNNRFFSREKYRYEEICSGSNLKTVFPLIKGVYQSVNLLKKYKPDVIVSFGSYHSLPPLLAGKALSIPLALHEANSIPGKVVRLMGRFSHVTGVQFPSAKDRLNGKVVEIPLPLRQGYRKADVSRKSAASYYGIDPNMTTLLIFGGSQGSQAINQAITAPFLYSVKSVLGPFQILHFSGSDDELNRLKELYEGCGIGAVVKKYEAHMNYAWGCSDLAIARSGASTIAEQLAFEIPAIYIPYPDAAENHQYLNALFVVNQVGGGDLLPQNQLDSAILAQKILAILSKEEHKLNLVHNIQNYNQQNCRQTLSEWILKL